jgi:hypothetical protein
VRCKALGNAHRESNRQTCHSLPIRIGKLPAQRRLCAFDDCPRLQRRVLATQQDWVDLARQAVQLVNAQIQIPQFVWRAREQFHIGQIVDGALQLRQRSTPYGVNLAPIDRIAAVIKRQAQDRRF